MALPLLHVAVKSKSTKLRPLMKYCTKYCLYLLLFFPVNLIAVFGQKYTNTENALQLGIGELNQRLIDEAFTQSRLKFTGNVFVSGLAYERTGQNHTIRAMLQYASGKVSLSSFDLNADISTIRMAFSYRKALQIIASLEKEPVYC